MNRYLYQTFKRVSPFDPRFSMYDRVRLSERYLVSAQKRATFPPPTVKDFQYNRDQRGFISQCFWNENNNPVQVTWDNGKVEIWAEGHLEHE